MKKQKTVPIEIYNKHIHNATGGTNYFIFRRDYVKSRAMDRLEALMIQDIINLTCLDNAKRITAVVDEEELVFFMCTAKFLERSLDWPKSTQSKIIDSLVKKGFVKVIHRGIPCRRYISIIFKDIQKSIDDGLEIRKQEIEQEEEEEDEPNQDTNQRSVVSTVEVQLSTVETTERFYGGRKELHNNNELQKEEKHIVEKMQEEGGYSAPTITSSDSTVKIDSRNTSHSSNLDPDGNSMQDNVCSGVDVEDSRLASLASNLDNNDMLNTDKTTIDSANTNSNVCVGMFRNASHSSTTNNVCFNSNNSPIKTTTNHDQLQNASHSSAISANNNTTNTKSFAKNQRSAPVSEKVDNYSARPPKTKQIDNNIVSNSKQSAFDNEMASLLARGLRLKGKIFLTRTLKQWPKAFTVLRKDADNDLDFIRNVVLQYIENIGKMQYLPRCYCAKTFCDNFQRIADALKISSIPEQEPEKAELSPEVEIIVNSLTGSMVWPKGSEANLPEAVQSCWESYTKLVNLLKIKTNQGNKEARCIWQSIPEPETFVEDWFTIYNKRICNWNEWNGIIKQFSLSGSDFQSYVVDRVRGQFNTDDFLKIWKGLLKEIK